MITQIQIHLILILIVILPKKIFLPSNNDNITLSTFSKSICRNHFQYSTGSACCAAVFIWAVRSKITSP